MLVSRMVYVTKSWQVGVSHKTISLFSSWVYGISDICRCGVWSAMLAQRRCACCGGEVATVGFDGEGASRSGINPKASSLLNQWSHITRLRGSFANYGVNIWFYQAQCCVSTGSTCPLLRSTLSFVTSLQVTLVPGAVCTIIDQVLGHST